MERKAFTINVPSEKHVKEADYFGLHTQFIGQIMDVKAGETVLGEKGITDIEILKPVIFAADTGGYYGFGKFIGKAYSIGKKKS